MHRGNLPQCGTRFWCNQHQKHVVQCSHGRQFLASVLESEPETACASHVHSRRQLQRLRRVSSALDSL
eukprot:2284973-Rhodomonas_salina.2